MQRRGDLVARVSSRRRFLKVAGAGALFLGACRRPAEDAPPPVVDSPGGGLRIDLRHSVRDGSHAFETLRLRREPHWPRRVGTGLPDWGDFRVSVGAAGGELLYREGFDSSIDSNARAATTELSVRVPLPAAPARVSLARRRAGHTFEDIAALDIDPRAGSIDATPAAVPARVEALLANGPPETKVNLAILGDGYRTHEHLKFVADARRAASYLLSVEPFARRTGDFNVTAVFAASAESGVTDPYLDRRSDTLLRCAYGEAAAERTLAVGDPRVLRDIASLVPYDFLLVLANARRYGGSACFGGPAVVAIDSAAAHYLVLHELGHVIGGLAEEYYLPGASGPEYRGNVEPWQPNVTVSPASGKWGAPPSVDPWNKAEYERAFAQYVRAYERLRARRADESIVEELMRRAALRQAALLAKNRPPRKVGCFEGAHGYAKGAYRSEADCIMFSLQTRYFCTACETALERMLGALLAARAAR